MERLDVFPQRRVVSGNDTFLEGVVKRLDDIIGARASMKVATVHAPKLRIKPRCAVRPIRQDPTNVVLFEVLNQWCLIVGKLWE